DEVKGTVAATKKLDEERTGLETRTDKFVGDRTAEMQKKYDDLRATIEAEGKKGPITAERAKEFQRSLDDLNAGYRTFGDNAKKEAEKTFDAHIKAQADLDKKREALKDKTADAVLKDDKDEAAERAKRPKVEPNDRLRLFPGLDGFGKPGA